MLVLKSTSPTMSSSKYKKKHALFCAHSEFCFSTCEGETFIFMMIIRRQTGNKTSANGRIIIHIHPSSLSLSLSLCFINHPHSSHLRISSSPSLPPPPHLSSPLSGRDEWVKIFKTRRRVSASQLSGSSCQPK